MFFRTDGKLGQKSGRKYMIKCSRPNKLIYIGMMTAALLCVACGIRTEPESVYRTKSDQDTTGVSGVESESVCEEESNQKQQFSYFINWEGHWNYPASIYHIGEVEIQPYFTPILLVEIPDDRQKEERINRMLLEHYVEVLPGAEEEDWWQLQEIRITYRSERYFCFRYVSNTVLPEGCDYYNLYVTLDLEQEKIIPYPVLEQDEKKNSPRDWGSLYQEIEAYQEKTIEEQNILRGEQIYEVQGITAECQGISFPSVEIVGLEDEGKQRRINGILQEPIRTCIMNGGWEDESMKQALFDKVKIYIAYKSEKWLSIVYSIQVRDFDRNYDGVADLGVTINLQSGERVLLDDLFDMNGLLTWMYACGRYKENDYPLSLLGILMTEEDILDYEAQEGVNHEGKDFLERYAYQWDTFYLYEGKLVITGKMGIFDFEIPLPEIVEYIVVDPWY